MVLVRPFSPSLTCCHRRLFMATIRKRHNRYQAQVRIGLVSRLASFSMRALR